MNVEKAQKIELKDKLQKLDSDKKATEQQKLELENQNKAKQEEIDKLNAQLQARIDARNASVVAKVQNTVSPKAYAETAQGDIPNIIRKWAAINGIDGEWAVGIARCESGFNVYAHNPSGATGLFQFMPSTFYGNGGTDIYSAEDQSRVATFMLAHGQAHQWVCK